MAKARKNYSKNKPEWHIILFYVLVGAIILSLLYYSGILNLKNFNSPEAAEKIEYYQ